MGPSSSASGGQGYPRPLRGERRPQGVLRGRIRQYSLFRTSARERPCYRTPVGASTFDQILCVEDYRLETGAQAQPGPRGSVRAVNTVRIWLLGRPLGPHGQVTSAFLEARSDWSEPALPRFQFTPPRILIAYTLPAIQPVVSLLLSGAPLYCQYRLFEGGSIHADVHAPRRGSLPHEDPHWVPEGP